MEYIKYLWFRYWKGCRNIGYAQCRWSCPAGKRRILLDEGMCERCYFEDYMWDYK